MNQRGIEGERNRKRVGSLGENNERGEGRRRERGERERESARAKVGCFQNWEGTSNPWLPNPMTWTSS